MYQIILGVHVLIAVVLIGLVLLQQGRGAGMGAAFGSGASQTVFGSRGSMSFLFKLTAFLAASFFATSLTLGYIVSQQVSSVTDPLGLTETTTAAPTTTVPDMPELPVLSPPSRGQALPQTGSSIDENVDKQ